MSSIKEFVVILGFIILASGLFMQIVGPEDSLLAAGKDGMQRVREQAEYGGFGR